MCAESSSAAPGVALAAPAHNEDVGDAGVGASASGVVAAAAVVEEAADAATSSILHEEPARGAEGAGTGACDYGVAGADVVANEADAAEVARTYELPVHYVDAWDRNHVMLPCSPRALSANGRTPLWHVICQTLQPPPRSLLKLISALHALRRAVRGTWTIRGFAEFVREHLNEAERTAFLETTLPYMCSLALRLPHLCASPIPLLLSGQAKSVSFTPEQGA